ncbi:MAG TPA: histidine--tRNA ligase, partial [Candidatus Polarisedimenticolia bacterium]|nr:histidine--tRNA ligase [Candidatus Polarisedimenticolia bacterium]
MPSFQAPRGMRDLLPEEAAAFDALQAVIEARAMRYGYPRIVTPVVEDRGVFVKGVGEASDIVGHEMYDVALHGQGGLTLRPEGTAAVTRAFLEHGLHRAPRPVRFFYSDPMFRGQRPQLLRYRQFWQWGLECFGPEEAAADVEIIDFTARLFGELGLRSYRLEVNTVGDAKCRPKIAERLASYFASNRDALSEDSRKRLETNPLRILDSKDAKDRALVAAAPPLHELLCTEDREHFEQVTTSLDRLGHEYKVNQTLVRGLDYYTRTVMECILTDPEFTKSGDIAVAAGGRYNDLVEKLGGPQVPGVGIAGGVDVLHAALKKEGV